VVWRQSAEGVDPAIHLLLFHLSGDRDLIFEVSYEPAGGNDEARLPYGLAKHVRYLNQRVEQRFDRPLVSLDPPSMSRVV
jgi:hypothetical protein